MVTCPQCGANTFSYNREYTHGEYITTGFCSSCGFTKTNDDSSEKLVADIKTFKEQMKGVEQYFSILNQTPVSIISDLAFAMIVASIGLIIFTGIPLALMIIPFVKYGKPSMIIGLIILIIYLLILLIVLIIGIIKATSEGMQYKQKVEIFNNDKNNAIKMIEQAYRNSNKIIPEKYYDPKTVDLILSFIENKQCLNLTDAINKLESDARYRQGVMLSLSQISATQSIANTINYTNRQLHK